MTTGASAEKVSIGSHASWPDRFVVGAPLLMTNERFVGSGAITGHYITTGTVSAVGCRRGAPSADGSGVTLSLAANSTSVLTYELRLAAPPWPGTDYDPQFSAAVAGASYRLNTPPISVTKPSGVRISLSARSPQHRESAGVLYVRRGDLVLISGTTDPVLARERIFLGYTARFPASSRERTGSIGVVRTDAHGRFTRKWRPRAGIYTIRATHRRSTPGMLADSNCDLGISAN
jgi:hypothetical protein